MATPENFMQNIAALEKENAYLKRKILRLNTQLWRQEKIDEMNRYQAKRANTLLEEARDAAELASRAKTEFLANMSHEIRTPLNILLGMGELLSETELSATQKKYLKSLRLSGEHLLQLINDILEFSRIESGSVEITASPFDLKLIINSIMTMGSHLCGEKNIGFEVVYNQSIVAERFGDSAKIKQIPLNLLGNAIKFTDRGKVTLSIDNISEDNNQVLLFMVRDTGIGIPENKQHVIFQRFAQVEDSHLRNKSGVGLGLAITERLVAAMGGTIGFESSEAKGTTFSVLLPLAIVDNLDRSPAEAAAGDLTPQHFPTLRLLAVDDIPLNLDVIINYLKDFPVKLDCAENGRQAVELYQKHPYDLILMDIRMPVMDGSEAARKIRRTEQENNVPPIRIIAMTAHAFEEQKKNFLQSGFDEVLTKPFSKQELISALLPNQQAKNFTFKRASLGNNVIGTVMENNIPAKIPPPLAQLIPELLQMFTGTSEKVNKALAVNDSSSLKEICHTAKGVAGMYGFKKIYTLTDELKRHVDFDDLEKADRTMKSLKLHIEKIKQDYPHLISK